MNILFALYGDFTTTSAIPVALYARELRQAGHACAAAVPSGLETASRYESPAFQPVLYDAVMAAPDSVFPDGHPADVIHACTPREVVRRFVTAYMARWPTPLVILLEDNERWLALQELKLDEAALARSTGIQVSEKLPDVLSHPFHYDSFIGLADAVAV